MCGFVHPIPDPNNRRDNPADDYAKEDVRNNFMRRIPRRKIIDFLIVDKTRFAGSDATHSRSGSVYRYGLFSLRPGS